MRIAIAGGGAGGLSAALLLARAGHEIVVVEQERLDPPPDVESAAASAFRQTAPQIVHPHAILARSRELLRERLPDVYENLLAAGVQEVPISAWMFDTLEDRTPWPGDDRLCPLMTRRSTLDWVLQKTVLAEPGIKVEDRVRVTGLLAEPGSPPRVTGVRTDQGELPSDLVIDASGRRTPIERWLSEIGAEAPTVSSGQCGLTYFSRHYRIRGGAALPGPTYTRIVAGLDEFSVAMLAGDNGAMQLVIAPLSTDHRFRRLAEPAVFEAMLRIIPAFDAWLKVLDPITPMFQMTAPNNVLRRLVIDGTPVVTGLHALGDSVCTTNPTFGRGVSLALWGATDLTDTLCQYPDDGYQQALAMDRCVALHTVPYFEQQVLADSHRLGLLRHNVYGEPAPDLPHVDGNRTTYAELQYAALYDPTAFRAFNRLTLLLATPEEVCQDPEIVATVKRTLASRGLDHLVPRSHLDPGIISPSPEQVAAALSTAG